MLPNQDASEAARLQRDANAERIRRWQGPLDERTSEVLTRIYVKRRIQYQKDYYDVKANEFEESSDGAFRAGAIILSVTSVLAAISTNEATPSVLHLFTAILPALAALIASFRALYQWDRQAQLYRDTILGLQRASLELPDLDQVDTQTAAKVYPKLVSAAEQVFYDEVQQWGQIALGDQDKDEGEDSIIKFANDYGIDIYDEYGELDDTKIASIKEMLSVARSKTHTNVLDLSVKGMPVLSETEAEQIEEYVEGSSDDIGAASDIIAGASAAAAEQEAAEFYMDAALQGSASVPAMSDVPVDDAGTGVDQLYPPMTDTPSEPSTMSDAVAGFSSSVGDTLAGMGSDADMAMSDVPVSAGSDAGMAMSDAYPSAVPMSDAPAVADPNADVGMVYTTPTATNGNGHMPAAEATYAADTTFEAVSADGSDAPADVDGFDATTIMARQYDDVDNAVESVESFEPAMLDLPGESFGSDAPTADFDDRVDAEVSAYGSDAPPESEIYTNGNGSNGNGYEGYVEETLTEFNG